MPVRETSFRIGCGRYQQEKNILEKIGEEVLRFGKAPVIIGDDTTLGIARAVIEKSISAACEKYEFIVHNGTCNEERAREIAEYMSKNGFDVVIGVGGGVLVDFAKLCAHFGDFPVINVPTSSAICASYVPLSVRYTPDGRTVGSLHYDREVNSVLADMAILSKQPTRLLVSGVFDSLAKFVEIKQRFNEDSSEYQLGLDYAYVMSKRAYKVLTEDTDGCIADMKSGKITDRVERVIFTAIAATGVISGIARGSNQCAVAHKFYEAARYLFNKEAAPYLHGEIVGVGLLLQNHFNDETEKNNFLLGLMKKYNMPQKVSDIGIETNGETLEKFYEKISASSAIDGNNADECRKLREGLEYLWSLG